MREHPVFLDLSGRRARALAWVGRAVLVLGSLATAVFLATLFILPPDRADGGDKRQRPTALVENNAGQPLATFVGDAALLAGRLQQQRASAKAGLLQPRTAGAGSAHPISAAFYMGGDEVSLPSLKTHIAHLDWFMPVWMRLKGKDLALSDSIDAQALNFIRAQKPGLVILPVIQNNDGVVWEGKELSRLLSDQGRQAKTADAIISFLIAHRFQGLTVDLESIPFEDQPRLQSFVAFLKHRLAARHLILAIALPFDDTQWDYAAYGRIADYTILMAYDQHSEAGDPGPIAGQSWYQRVLAERMRALDPSRTIVSIGAYGYDWSGKTDPTDLTYQEAVLAARDSDAKIRYDQRDANPHFSYVETDGATHRVWFLDGVTAFNEIHFADQFRPAGYALWRLGTGDPSLWSVLGRAYGASAPPALKELPVAQDIEMAGTGEIMRVAETPVTGRRSFSLDPASGMIVDENYLKVPTPYLIRRSGDLDRQVALSFDDGPDAQWTGPILDILKSRQVKATFFITGENAEANPDLVRRMVDEGHDVGNHTFTHPNLDGMPAAMIRLELNATERLFEALTGRALRLFRPPYLGDTEASSPAEVDTMKTAQDMGYTTIGLRIDPSDWRGSPPPGTLVQRVLAQIAETDPDHRGHIILLHDSGGDRSATVAALPQLIDAVRAKGYKFVPVSALAGMSRDGAMPAIAANSISMIADRPAFFVLGWGAHLFDMLFQIAVWLALARCAFLAIFAVRQKLSEPPPPPLETGGPLVSVVIPAFNEEAVIATAVRRVLASTYRSLEVIVVDDGSSDLTAKVARYIDDARLTVISIPNSGKGAAINAGIAIAKGKVLVALDADTQFEAETVARLVRWFADPKVGAVAGNAKVGNRLNLLTRWQALEYIISQNLERRAYAALGAVTVVPGAVGAWRIEAVNKAGGFSGLTSAEDQDMTLAVQQLGYDVVFDSEAVAWTEAPETLGALAQQRIRWSFGTLQCLWTRRAQIFRPSSGALGMVVLPQTWLFQLGMGLLSPLVDLLFLRQIVMTGVDYLEHANQFDADALIRTCLFYVAFVLADLAIALTAFALEARSEDRRLLWWLIPQRFGYRQILYYVSLKSVIAALSGQAVLWGRTLRSANARAPA